MFAVTLICVGKLKEKFYLAASEEYAKRLRGYVPALDRDVDFHITYIAPQADFATWAATRTQGGFDIRTFAVKAKPLGAEEGMRPGMSVLVDWDAIE